MPVGGRRFPYGVMPPQTKPDHYVDTLYRAGGSARTMSTRRNTRSMSSWLGKPGLNCVHGFAILSTSTRVVTSCK